MPLTRIATLIVVLLGTKELHVESDRIEGFKKRIGFSKLAERVGVDGVWAHWNDLPGLLSTQLRGLKLDSDDADVTPFESGIAGRYLTWKGREKKGDKPGDRYIALRIFVSSMGPVPVRDRLVSMVSETTRIDIPYQPGPAGLGELSIRSIHPGSDSIVWVYGNVCVDVMARSDMDVEPIARSIQRFMEAHHVARIAEHFPRVDRIDVSAKKIRVGEEWRVTIGLGRSLSPESVVTTISSEDDRLETVVVNPLTATFRGLAPGPARVEIRVIDRQTLLSPPLSVTVDVLPAP